MKTSTLAFLLASLLGTPVAASTVVVGYKVEAFGAAFSQVQAPSFAQVPDPDGYDLTVGSTTIALASGETVDFFTVFGVNPTSFTISDIDPALALDPNDIFAFPIGIALTSSSGPVRVSATPILSEMSPVPLPASLVFLGAGVLAFGAMGRSRRRVSDQGCS